MDLNRNFVDHANPPLNERYELYRHLTPFTDASQGRAAAGGCRCLPRAKSSLDAASASSGSNGGQYHDPKGITFGGQARKCSGGSLSVF